MRGMRTRFPAKAGIQPAPGRFDHAIEAMRVILGLGSYTAYREHMAQAHPEQPTMTETEFFRARQEARYGGGQGRCC